MQPSALRQRRRFALPLWVFAVACAGCASGAAQPGASPRAGEACSVQLETSSILRLSSGEVLYVEPSIVSAAGSSVLLAGLPNYLYSSTPTGERGVATDSLFGVVIRKNGSVAPVSLPRPIIAMRASPAGESAWDIVFAEADSGYTFPGPERVRALWHGVLHDTTWQSVVQIPVPRSLGLASLTSSPLVRTDGALAWAVSYHNEDSAGVALFQNHGRGWFPEIMTMNDVVYATLAWSRAHGLALLPVRGGAALGQSNTLFYYRGAPEWRPVHMLVPGGDEPVHRPMVQLATQGHGDVVSWLSRIDENPGRMEARALVGDVERNRTRTLVLDTNAHQLLAAQLPGGAPLWVVQSSAHAATQLRFLSLDALGALLEIARAPGEFSGIVGLTETEPGRLLLAGPALKDLGSDTTLVTALVAANTRCNRG